MQRLVQRLLWLVAVGAPLVWGGVVRVAASADGPPAGAGAVRFNDHIRPIFTKHCTACHGGVRRLGGVSFVRSEGVLGAAASGRPAVVPGDPDASPLLERVAAEGARRMPPPAHGPPLTLAQVSLLRAWVAQGAVWEEPWGFVPPRPHDPPEVGRSDWPRTGLDRYVLARLEREGLAPAPEAPRAEWLRRVTFDLTGLPPTEAEHRAFLQDSGEEAYGRVADRLLGSPHYGERWASVWLDLARYADTMGYEKDPHRDVWPYRDWLIRALNDDLPYDAFTVKQLAGDLLPDATLDDRLATAFHRNTQTNNEGGTDDEEFRVAAVLDRVNTTWQAWQATTMGCAQCHDHPYDPVTHEEYYRAVAVFNNTRDADLTDDAPRLAVPLDRGDYPRAERLDRRIARQEAALHALVAPGAESSAGWRPVALDRASSSGSTRLTLRPTGGGPLGRDVLECLAGGTISLGSRYTLGGPTPEGLTRITALKLVAGPIDPEAARRIPEQGFTVGRLTVRIERPDGPAGAAGGAERVDFQVAVCDDPHPLTDPQRTLHDDPQGWGSPTKVTRDRWCVFLPRKPVEVPAGARLTLVLEQPASEGGDRPQVIRRGSVWVSSDPAWAELAASERLAGARRALEGARRARRQIASTGVPVVAEAEGAARRETQVFVRGNWLDRGDGVTPGAPGAVPPSPSGGGFDRLALARWLVSGENPLTARVQVNRLWAQLFGAGIVPTLDDFGASGEAPSHPELLDYLALRLQNEHGWRVKPLLRELVLSATYRQASRVTAEGLERDPTNRLLTRGPRQRLSAEMVRDQALALSGRLADTLYGPPAMPYQPPGVWRSVYSGAAWETSPGAGRFRRAVYTYWKRTSPYPSLETFDAPSREVCQARRVATNTPLQALATLNDPAQLELAEGFARRMARHGGGSPERAIAWGYERATGDVASAADVATLARLHRGAVAAYSAPNGGPADAGDAERFGLAVVAGALLNLDESLTR